MSAFVAPTGLGLAAARSSSFVTSAAVTSGSLRFAAMASRSLRARFASVHHNVTSLSMELEMDMENDSVDDRGDEEAPVPEETKLFVGNLSWDTTNSSLGEAFEGFGTVVDARVVMDRFTGKSRGFGFIEFDEASSAEEALVGMNGVEVDGRAVRVDRANRRPPKRRTYY